MSPGRGVLTDNEESSNLANKTAYSPLTRAEYSAAAPRRPVLIFQSLRAKSFKVGPK